MFLSLSFIKKIINCGIFHFNRSYSELTNFFTPVNNYKELISIMDADGKAYVSKKYKGLAGIYCWQNKITGQMYVGLSQNLAKRIKSYFRPNDLKHQLLKGQSAISAAILKYGIINFQLYILEVLPNADRETLNIREGFWVSTLKPVYNLATTGAGSYITPETAQTRLNRMASSLRMGRTTTILCYDFDTGKFLFEFIGVRALALHINKVPGTLRHHLNNGTPLYCKVHGKDYKLKITRKES